MVEGNRFIAVALVAHLLALLVSVFPKSAVAQKMYFSTEQLENQGPKVEQSLQVWFPKGLDTDKCRGQGADQINCVPNIMQMTEEEDD